MRINGFSFVYFRNKLVLKKKNRISNSSMHVLNNAWSRHAGCAHTCSEQLRCCWIKTNVKRIDKNENKNKQTKFIHRLNRSKPIITCVMLAHLNVILILFLSSSSKWKHYVLSIFGLSHHHVIATIVIKSNGN